MLLLLALMLATVVIVFSKDKDRFVISVAIVVFGILFESMHLR